LANLDNEEFEDDDLDDSEWDEMDELNKITVVDKQNPILFLKEGFTYVQTTYPEYYTSLLGLIGTEGMSLLEAKIKESENN
jgi:hypothetical protein